MDQTQKKKTFRIDNNCTQIRLHYQQLFLFCQDRVVYSAVLAKQTAVGSNPAQAYTNACGHICKYMDQKSWLPC